MNLMNASAHEIHTAFIEGSISAIEIVQFFLSRIDKFDSNTQAFIKVLKEEALHKAENLDQKRASNKPLGKLAGIPVALKDNIHIEGVNTTCSSKFLENYRAPFSATVTRLLEMEDAIIIGKTNLDEFAMGSSTEHSAFFPTKNPWSLDSTPGGSSGGSAAAVAGYLSPLALGSDTGGSIRQPASFCGVVGFKPTYGRVSRFGLVAFGSSLDQIGPFARSVTDSAKIMEVLGQHCLHDSTSIPEMPQNYLDNLKTNLEGKTIGVPWSFLKNLNENSLQHFEKTVDILKDLGAKIIDIDLSILEHSVSVYYILATAEASTNLARFDGIRYGKRAKADNLRDVYFHSKEEGFGPEVKQRILLGTYVLSSGYQDAYYRKAQKVRTLITDAFSMAFKQCDSVALPCTPTSAFKLGAIQDPLQMYLQDIFTIGANLAGLPAISVPSGFDSDEKPLALQLIAPQKHDVDLHSYAYAFEQAINIFPKIPKGFSNEEAQS